MLTLNTYHKMCHRAKHYFALLLFFCLKSIALEINIPCSLTHVLQNNLSSIHQKFINPWIAPWRNPHIHYNMIIKEQPSSQMYHLCLQPYFSGGSLWGSILRHSAATGGIAWLANRLVALRGKPKSLTNTALFCIASILCGGTYGLEMGSFACHFIYGRYLLHEAYCHNTSVNWKNVLDINHAARKLRVCDLNFGKYEIEKFKALQTLLQQEKIPGCSADTERIMLEHFYPLIVEAPHVRHPATLSSLIKYATSIALNTHPSQATKTYLNLICTQMAQRLSQAEPDDIITLQHLCTMSDHLYNWDNYRHAKLLNALQRGIFRTSTFYTNLLTRTIGHDQRDTCINKLIQNVMPIQGAVIDIFITTCLDALQTSDACDHVECLKFLLQRTASCSSSNHDCTIANYAQTHILHKNSDKNSFYYKAQAMLDHYTVLNPQAKSEILQKVTTLWLNWESQKNTMQSNSPVCCAMRQVCETFHQQMDNIKPENFVKALNERDRLITLRSSADTELGQLPVNVPETAHLKDALLAQPSHSSSMSPSTASQENHIGDGGIGNIR